MSSWRYFNQSNFKVLLAVPLLLLLTVYTSLTHMVSFYPKFSKSPPPLIIYETIHKDLFQVVAVPLLCARVCVHECVHEFVHMYVFIGTHASLQPFVMSLFYSETFYEVHIVRGFGDHQHNWQKHNECFFLFSALPWPVCSCEKV